MGTINAQDAFSRIMLEPFDTRQYAGVPLGFGAFFGNPATGARTVFAPDASSVDIDIIGGNTKVAATIPRGLISGSLGPNMKTDLSGKYTAFARVFPLIEERCPYAASELIKRVAGEKPYGGKTQIERLRSKAQFDSAEMSRRIFRAHELLASQSIRTGKHDAIIGTTDPNLQYDFKRDAVLTYAAPAVWTNAATDIMAHIKTILQRGKDKGHVDYDVMILGGTTLTGFQNNTQIKALADNVGFKIVNLDSDMTLPPEIKRLRDSGFQLIGKLDSNGVRLWVFGYNASYTNAAGNTVLYMPDDEAVFAYSGARCDRIYGPGEVMPMTPEKAAMMRMYFGIDPNLMLPTPDMTGAILDTRMIGFDAYMMPEDKGVVLRAQSAPILPTTFANGFAQITGTA